MYFLATYAPYERDRLSRGLPVVNLQHVARYITIQMPGNTCFISISIVTKPGALDLEHFINFLSKKAYKREQGGLKAIMN